MFLKENNLQMFSTPNYDTMLPENRRILDHIREGLGFVPNMYAILTKSQHALSSYLQFQNRPSLFQKREKEVINLIVSQVNGDLYGQAEHTMFCRLNDFQVDELFNLRMLFKHDDKKIESLAILVAEILKTKGKIGELTLKHFFSAGYSEAHLVELVLTIGEKTILNYLWRITQAPIDFPPVAGMTPL
jgi:alkylhydroperoxidase family enzyme